MDVATHFLVPYAAALASLGFWRRGGEANRDRAALALAFGLAGAAPDVDGATDFLSELSDSLYWLQHRGASHALVGAPVFALALLGGLALLARQFPSRLGLLEWRWAFVPVAFLGSWTHLLLDMVTLAGVPLWWPFSFERVTLGLYHWLVWWLFPVGVLVALAHAFGKLSRRGVLAAGAVIVAALLAIAAVRAYTMPRDEGPGALVFPRASEIEWVVAEPYPNGSWSLHTYRFGDRSQYVLFDHRVPPEAEDAVALARGSDAYRGFLLGRYGPETVIAAPEAGGGWNVTFTDVAARYEATHDPTWTPVKPYADWGFVAFTVRGGEIEVTHRGW